jgi:hypothetical protein
VAVGRVERRQLPLTRQHLHIQYPDNWRLQSDRGWACHRSDGGIVQASDGTPVIVYGAIVNH